MKTLAWLLIAGALAPLLLCGCTEHKRQTTIEERTTTVIESRPVITPGPGSPAAPGPARSETSETREERVISREPLVK